MFAFSTGDIAAKDLGIRDPRGDPQGFVAEAFCNSRNILVMVSEAKARRRIARGLRVAAG